jgi:glycosyltransferase involved in cell wall biosynthesis
MTKDDVQSGGRILIIAYHFPPCVGSSGLLRSLKYSRYLSDYGWQPCVLSLRPSAYEAVDSRTETSIPPSVPVIRAFAFDAKKALSFRGFYLDLTAMPDRWWSWTVGAIPAGLRAIRKHDINVIFSTFPISTAVLIGLLLHILTGKPWVVDFRDSMTEENYPPSPVRRYIWRWIERQAVRRACRLIFTSPSALRMYLSRYPQLAAARCLLIPNGFDEEDFSSLAVEKPARARQQEPLKLLHTGLIYPDERDPRPFFHALHRLKKNGSVDSGSLNVLLRAAGSESLYQSILNDLDINDIVQLLPHIPYNQALEECAHADGLLLFQAANCDHQTPAKAYEYLRLHKPVLALTTQSGDTAALLREVGGATILDLADEDAICAGLPLFLESLRNGSHPLPNAEKIKRYDRRAQARQLAICLSDVQKELGRPDTYARSYSVDGAGEAPARSELS